MYTKSADEYYRSERETSRVNTHGDRYKKNELGQITSFRYGHSDILFTFNYAADGNVADIDSSSGWSWTRISAPGFDGWLVRNYFERWYVSAQECSEVHVTEFGVKAAGSEPGKMELPERP